MPKQKEIVYDGKNVQLLLLGRTFVTHSPNAGYNGMTHTDHVSMLFAKKIGEDHFTYVGYYPEKKDQISVTPFKKHGALYVKDFAELAEKVAKKKKGYKRFNAVAVFKEYDQWLSNKG